MAELVTNSISLFAISISLFQITISKNNRSLQILLLNQDYG